MSESNSLPITDSIHESASCFQWNFYKSEKKVLGNLRYCAYYTHMQTNEIIYHNDNILRIGCRGSFTNRRIVYLATPLDQFQNQNYPKIRSLIAGRFSSREWAIFEPARCTWTTKDWLKAWPRLIRWIDALVIWARPDGSVGFGVYQEARDIAFHGKPVYVLKSGCLKTLHGFSLLRGGSFRYARVQAGRVIQEGEDSNGPH